MSEGPLNPQELDRKLSQLGARLALCEEDDREGIRAIAADLATWLDFTAGLPSYPAGLLGAQTRQVLHGLETGRPTEHVCRRLSQTMAEAVHHMAQVLSGGTSPAPKVPESIIPSLGALETFFAINPDDLGGFKDFTAEAPEHLQAIESGLLALVQGEAWDPLKVYRPFHTLKGICGFMGLTGLAKLTHQAEAILEKYKNGQGRPTELEVDHLFAAGDLMKQQTQLIAQGLASGKFRLLNVEPILAEIAGGLAAKGEAPSLRGKGHKTEGRETQTHVDQFLRIGVDKMDSLLETVGELAICQSQVTEGVAASGVLGHLAIESSRLAKISRQLQEIVLSLRMVPVLPLFHRMARLARDLSQKTGKPLRVEVEGGETELDKRLTEELVDPLVHLIRNAVDHGLEGREDRVLSGKPAEAVLSLKASHQGGDFILRVEDDGKGLDFDKLRLKGAALGHLGEGEVSRERLIELIFRAGFSTAEKVTEVSGRGVGLDAVRRKIQTLKGSIRVESEPGKGTCFILRIPLTMALIDAILVRVGASRYVLPSFHVKQFMALRETQSHRVSEGREWLTTTFGHIPIVELSEWFGVEADQKGQPVVVHVQVGDKDACLVVDEVVGKQQVVVKGLGEHLSGLPGVAGGAILGDGQVGFILDLNALVQGGRTQVVLAAVK